MVEYSRIGGGIVFPVMFDVKSNPEGAIVTFGEKDGVFYEIGEEMFNDSPLLAMHELYNTFGNLRYYFKGDRSLAARLDIKRSPDVAWRPSFIPAPYSVEDEARNIFFSLLKSRRLKLKPKGLLYNAIGNIKFQKTPPILEAAFHAIIGMKKYVRH